MDTTTRLLHVLTRSAAIGFVLLLTTDGAFADTPASLIPSDSALSKSIVASAQGLTDYAKLFAELDGKPKVTQADTERLQQAAKTAAASLTSLSAQVPELIQQAKKANTWEQADAIVTQNVQKSDLAAKEKTALLDFLKRGGGAQSVIENSPKVFGQGRSAIEQDVAAMKGKQASLLFDLIISPALAKPNETVCSVVWHGVAILNGIGALGGAVALLGAKHALGC